jgi:hypothetical protein
MPINSRNKGAAFEREISKLILDNLGIKTQRQLVQYQQAGLSDLVGLPGWSVECKRYKAASHADKRTWWKQACISAELEGGLPVVIYKVDRQEIRCIIALQPEDELFEVSDYQGTADISLELWFALVRESLN